MGDRKFLSEFEQGFEAGKEEADAELKAEVVALKAENKRLTLTLTSVKLPPDAAQVAVQRMRAEDAVGYADKEGAG